MRVSVRPDYGLVKWRGAVVGPESNQPPSGVFGCVCENRTGVARSGALAMAVLRPAAWPDWFEAKRQQRAARPPELAAIESAVEAIRARRAAVELTLDETPSPAARGSVGAIGRRGIVPLGVQIAGRALAAVSPHRGRRVLSGAGPYIFGHFRGPLWRFCEAVFTLAPSKSRIPRRGWADATNAPQICELQVTGFRRPGRPRRRPPAGAAGQALDENVGTARGVKRARSAARRRGTFAADKKRGRPLGSERPCLDDPSTMPV